MLLILCMFLYLLDEKILISGYFIVYVFTSHVHIKLTSFLVWFVLNFQFSLKQLCQSYRGRGWETKRVLHQLISWSTPQIISVAAAGFFCSSNGRVWSLLRVSHVGCRCPRPWVVLCCSPGSYAGSWTGSGALGKWSGAPMGCQCCGWGTSLIRHWASPERHFLWTFEVPFHEIIPF